MSLTVSWLTLGITSSAGLQVFLVVSLIWSRPDNLTTQSMPKRKKDHGPLWTANDMKRYRFAHVIIPAYIEVLEGKKRKAKTLGDPAVEGYQDAKDHGRMCPRAPVAQSALAYDAPAALEANPRPLPAAPQRGRPRRRPARTAGTAAAPAPRSPATVPAHAQLVPSHAASALRGWHICRLRGVPCAAASASGRGLRASRRKGTARARSGAVARHLVEGTANS